MVIFFLCLPEKCIHYLHHLSVNPELFNFMVAGLCVCLYMRVLAINLTKVLTTTTGQQRARGVNCVHGCIPANKYTKELHQL